MRPLQKSGFWIYKKSDVLYDEVPALIQRSDRLDRGGSSLSTSLTFKDGQQVLTVEHLFSSMAGIGITAALVEVEGEEIPILDGSALPFVEAFLETGLVEVEANNGNGDAKRTPSQRQVNAMASAMLGNFADITESVSTTPVTLSNAPLSLAILISTLVSFTFSVCVDRRVHRNYFERGDQSRNHLRSETNDTDL